MKQPFKIADLPTIQKMPSRKTRNRKVNTTAPPVETDHTPTSDSFPFTSYASLVGVHTTLLVFVALFLARVPQALRRSPSFPEGLTRDPMWTVAWICAGAVPLQGWWAGWVRKWVIDSSLKGTDTDRRLDRDKGKFSASLLLLICVILSLI